MATIDAIILENSVKFQPAARAKTYSRQARGGIRPPDINLHSNPASDAAGGHSTFLPIRINRSQSTRAVAVASFKEEGARGRDMREPRASTCRARATLPGHALRNGERPLNARKRKNSGKRGARPRAVEPARRVDEPGLFGLCARQPMEEETMDLEVRVEWTARAFGISGDGSEMVNAACEKTFVLRLAGGRLVFES